MFKIAMWNYDVSYFLTNLDKLSVSCIVSCKVSLTSLTNLLENDIFVQWEWWSLLSEKCPYSEFIWSEFSRIRPKYGKMQSISLYLGQTGENTD